jgi:hypothetical protein
MPSTGTSGPARRPRASERQEPARSRSRQWSAEAIKTHADRYSPAVFATRLQTIADEVCSLQPALQPALSVPAPLLVSVGSEASAA